MEEKNASPYDDFDPSPWELRLATPSSPGSSGGSSHPSPTATAKLMDRPTAEGDKTPEHRPIGRLLKLTHIDTISDTIPDACDSLRSPSPSSFHPSDSCPNNNVNENGVKKKGFFFRRKPKDPKTVSPKKSKAAKDKSKDKEKKKVKEKNKKNAKGKKADLEEQTVQIPTSSYPEKSGSELEINIPQGEEVYQPPSKTEQCMSCCKKFLAFLFSTIGLSCLMIAYTFFGGFIFMNLEAPSEVLLKNSVQQQKHLHVERLWNLTEEMNVLYPENWTKVALEVLESYTREVYDATKRKGWDGKDGETELQWTFAGSMLYSITVITTIGYGHIAPKTDWGRVVTILYAIVGIPLTLLTISNLGSIMATAFRFIYKNICCGLCCMCCSKPSRSMVKSSVKYRDAENGDPGASKRLTGSPEHNAQKPSVYVTWRRGISRLLKTNDNKTVSVPIYISLLLITSYIFGGAVMFTIWEEDWDLLVGSYFCFITLTTIGFGDYVPGTAIDSWASQEKLIICSMYLLFGLALIAMCFDLMQEEVRNKCRSLAKKVGLITKKQNNQGGKKENNGKNAKNGKGMKQ